MLVDQPERPAEQVDACGDDGRPHAVVVQHDRLDEIVGVAPVIRRVNDPTRACGRLDDVEMLDPPIDLPKNRVQRVLERAIERISLRRSELFEVGEDPFAPVRTPVRAAKISHHVLAREDSLGEIVRNHEVPAL